MTFITKEEEEFIDDDKAIRISRGNRQFIIEPGDVIAYGEIDFNHDSEDMESLAESVDWYNTGLTGFIMPTQYDYKTHTVTSDVKGGRRYDTTRCEVVAQYAHGCLDKPKRTIIFKNDADKRSYIKGT